jgi:hypothetical protein
LINYDQGQMKYHILLANRTYLKSAKIWLIALCALIAYLFTGIDVKAQLPFPCVDSTPFCPCLLADGNCMDIDTPIDNDLLVLLLVGVCFGVFRLRTSKPI